MGNYENFTACCLCVNDVGYTKMIFGGCDAM